MDINIKLYNIGNMHSNTSLFSAKTFNISSPHNVFIGISCIKTNYCDPLACPKCALIPRKLFHFTDRNSYFHIHNYRRKVSYLTEVNLASIQHQISNRMAIFWNVVDEDILRPIRQGKQVEWVKICHLSQVGDFLNSLRVQTALGGKRIIMHWIGEEKIYPKLVCLQQGTDSSVVCRHSWVPQFILWPHPK